MEHRSIVAAGFVAERAGDPALPPRGTRRSMSSTTADPRNRDQNLGWKHFPVDRHAIAGKIYEKLVARCARPPHGRRNATAPFVVKITEPAAMLCTT